MPRRVVNLPRARQAALAVGLGALASAAGAPASWAAGVGAKPPTPGVACQTDGKISGRGGSFATNAMNKALILTYEHTLCAVGNASNLSSGYTTAPPSGAGGIGDPIGATPLTGAPANAMIAYNDYTGVQTGSGAGLSGISCRTDAFAATSLAPSNADYALLDGFPGAEVTGTSNSSAPASCTGGNSEYAPFGPELGSGSGSVGADSQANLMTFPVAGGAVAVATNLNGVCPLPVPTGLSLTSYESNGIWQGTINRWNDASLLLTDPGANPSLSTTTDVAQTLPTLTSASGAQSLPVAGGTLNVGSTTGFPAAGALEVESSAGTEALSYTGSTGTSFTGVTGGTGTIAGNAVVAGVGTLTVSSLPSGFPTSGAVAVALSGGGTAVVRYTGVSGNALTGVTTDTSGRGVLAGATVTTTSPLAGCTWGPIQRAVRFDTAGETTLLDSYLNGVETANSAGNLCDTEFGSTWGALANPPAPAPNTNWPLGCKDSIGNTAPAPVTSGTKGESSLVAKLNATPGGIAYAELGSFASPPAGVSLAKLESATGTASAGYSDNDATTIPATSFAAAGSPGSASACNVGALGLPGSGGTAQAVGLGGTNSNWAYDSSPNYENLTYAGSGYPVCGLVFGLVYQGINPYPAPSGSTGSTLTTTGPEQELNYDQLRTLYSFFTIVLSPLGQEGVAVQGGANTGLNAQTYDQLPAAWLDNLRIGFQNNY